MDNNNINNNNINNNQKKENYLINKIQKNKIFSDIFFKFGNARYNKFEEISKFYKFNNNLLNYNSNHESSRSNDFRKNRNNLILNDIDYLNNKLLNNNDDKMKKNTNNLEYLYKLYSGDGSYKNIFST